MRRRHRRTVISSLRPWSIGGLTSSVLQRSRRTGCRKAVVSKSPQGAGDIRELKGVCCVSCVGAALCCGDCRSDASLNFRRGVGDQYRLGLSGARLAVVLRAGVSSYGGRGPVRAWTPSCGSFCGPADCHADGAAHAMGATHLGALVSPRGGPGGVAPGGTWGSDGLVAVTPRGIGNACVSGAGISVYCCGAGSLYGPWLADASG